MRRYAAVVASLTSASDAFDAADGKLMATVDFPSYCGVGQTDADFSPPLTFCLFQISHDLNTAVTVTCHNQALAVDLNDYFRYELYINDESLLETQDDDMSRNMHLPSLCPG